MIVVDQKGLSAEFLQKVSAEIRQKVFLPLLGLSVILQKRSLLAERPSFCRNGFFLQANSSLDSSMVLHFDVKHAKKFVPASYFPQNDAFSTF